MQRTSALPETAAETYTAQSTAAPAVQSNEVYPTPCTAVPSISFGSASDKRYSFGVTKYMRSIVIAIGMLLALAGQAVAQPRQSFESIVVPCEMAPPEAKTQLPAKLAEWAVLSCTRFGHVVSAAQGWVWHNPRTNSFVRVWSQPSDGDLSESGHENYFKSLEFRQLAPREAEQANAMLAAELGASAQPVADAYALVLVDVRGRTQVVNFVRSEANVRLGNFWGWSCTSPCAKAQVFMGIKPRQ